MSSASTPAFRLSALLFRLGDDVPLDQAAGLIAEDEDPEIEAEEVVGMLDELAAPIELPDEVALLLPERTAVLRALGRVGEYLFEDLGYEGDQEDYDDPANSLMHRVIQRRRGLPILMSVLYIEVARRVGVTLRGVGFPGHFVVTPEMDGPRVYIDPFHGGDLLREEDLAARLLFLVPESADSPELKQRFLGPCSTRYILSRMSNNLRGSYLRRGDPEGVLRCVDRLMLLQPEVVEHHRDRGLALLGLERVQEGADELKGYLERKPDAPEAEALRAHLSRVTQRGG